MRKKKRLVAVKENGSNYCEKKKNEGPNALH